VTYIPKPPEHTKWKAGQSGNPAGRPKGIIRRDDIQALLGKFWNLDREALHAIVANPRSSMGDIMVASVMAKAAKDGDYARLSFLLDRMIGRPTETVEQTIITDKDSELRKVGEDDLAALLRKVG